MVGVGPSLIGKGLYSGLYRNWISAVRLTTISSCSHCQTICGDLQRQLIIRRHFALQLDKHNQRWDPFKMDDYCTERGEGGGERGDIISDLGGCILLVKL